MAVGRSLPVARSDFASARDQGCQKQFHPSNIRRLDGKDRAGVLMVVVVSPDDEASGFTHILTGPLAHVRMHATRESAELGPAKLVFRCSLMG